MDYLGLVAIILGLMLLLMGVGMTFKIEILEMIMQSFMGVIAMLFGLVLLLGGALIVRDDQ